LSSFETITFTIIDSLFVTIEKFPHCIRAIGSPICMKIPDNNLLAVVEFYCGSNRAVSNSWSVIPLKRHCGFSKFVCKLKFVILKVLSIDQLVGPDQFIWSISVDMFISVQIYPWCSPHKNVYGIEPTPYEWRPSTLVNQLWVKPSNINDIVLFLKRSANWVDWWNFFNLGPCLHLFGVLVRCDLERTGLICFGRDNLQRVRVNLSRSKARNILDVLSIIHYPNIFRTHKKLSKVLQAS
jgi:hypothetical protein